MPPRQFEPRDNSVFVCAEHAPRPVRRLSLFAPELYVGKHVKKSFLTTTGGREHMWIRVDAVTPDGQLQGPLDNIPVQDCGVRYGEIVTVRLEEIEAVLGGFPTKVDNF